MKVRIKEHDIVLEVEYYDEKTKVVTVKMFGAMCKFQEYQYEVVEEKLK